MYASRFEMPEEKPATLGQKLLAAASGLKITMHRRDDNTVLMSYHLEGDFGEAESEDDFPEVENAEAKATARELMAAFLGGGK